VGDADESFPGEEEGSESGPFPTDQESVRLIVGPESITWQFTSDVRLLLAPLCALLLQVAHPVVAAGVRDYSDFDRRPWERLLRTLDYLVLLQYGGHEAAAVGRTLRELHKRFTGVRDDGAPYYALERRAYAWVHATLLETYVRAHAHFGRPMTRDQLERFYREYLGLGRLVGVRAGDLPPTWEGFRDYFEHTVTYELGPNATVDRVLRTARRPAAPPLPTPGVIVWRAFRPPVAKATYLGGVGLLGASLRHRLGIPWSRGEEVQFRALGASTRALDPLLPAGLKVLGPTQLRWRRRAIARGPFGEATPRAG
jgi:uncharacterized protein (DUF2236 family)